MTENTHPLPGRSRLTRAWDALVADETSPVAAADAIDESVSFAELVWAHHERQRRLEAGEPAEDWDREYRRRLRIFKAEYGHIVEAYWCRYEASGVALTARHVRRRFRQDETILRLHTATDWRTGSAPKIATALHDCEALAIRVTEILRYSTERVALHSLYAATTRLLAFVDKQQDEPPPEPKEVARVISSHGAELRRIESYYRRAGENAARIVYFEGMAIGAFFLGLLLVAAAVVAWQGVGAYELEDLRVQNLLVSASMGALGAIVSVMTRMASSGSYSSDFEVGRKPVRRLGSLRPYIGATFALVLYLAVKSSLLEIGNVENPGIYFFATVSFLAGFSERRAKVLLDRAAGGLGVAPTRDSRGDSRD
jgi:hypothetical protein